jgi:hypothetical protein
VFKVIATVPEPLTVKVVVPLLEDESVAMIVCVPADAPDGTLKVTPDGIAPALVVVTVVGLV